MIMAKDTGGMNNKHLDALIRELGEDVKGELGFWEFSIKGRRICCIADETRDRVRLITPIMATEELSQQQVMSCMSANFDRALDARYCIHEETLWGAFMHPLSSLRAKLFRSACSQVAEVAINFGQSYSSGKLRFGSS